MTNQLILSFMQRTMLFMSHDLQVFNTIICRITVDVMNHFTTYQFSTKMHFHDVPMRINTLPVNSNAGMSICAPVWVTSFRKSSEAFCRAKSVILALLSSKFSAALWTRLAQLGVTWITPAFLISVVTINRAKTLGVSLFELYNKISFTGFAGNGFHSPALAKL